MKDDDDVDIVDEFEEFNILDKSEEGNEENVD